MSQANDGGSSKRTPATIKIAPKDPSKRASGGSAGGAAGQVADPGPGDPAAAPSVAPQLVDIPEPPTASQLVVKSGPNSSRPPSAIQSSSAIRTLSENSTGTGPKSVILASMSKQASRSHHSVASLHGSQAGPAASNPSTAAAREPTSSRPLTGPSGAKSISMASSPKSTLGASGGAGGSMRASAANFGGSAAERTAASGTDGGAGGGLGANSFTGGAGAAASHMPSSGTGTGRESSKKSTAALVEPSSPATASTAMQADSGAIHDEDEEGEGELEHHDEGTSPMGSPSAASGGVARSSGADAMKSASSMGSSKKMSSKGPDDVSLAPASSGGGMSKASTKTGGRSPLSSFGPDSSDASGSKGGKKAKKVTKFRYHKRITVRTSGKTSPSAIMEKVHKKDHKAALTPSTIEEMDPQELMRRAGIKGSKQTHWRVRLRQTKRLTKNGRTTTQTKVAYRDSEGNKRVKTSSSPFCKQCGKKLEECKCYKEE